MKNTYLNVIQPRLLLIAPWCKLRLEKLLAWSKPRAAKACAWFKPRIEKSVAWCKPRLQKAQTKCQPYLEKLLIWWRPQQEKIKMWAAPHVEKLQARWQTLSARDKKMLQGGGVLTAILLFYALFWAPLNSHIDNLRTQIEGEKKTAAWMQAADLQLRMLENKPDPNSGKGLSQRVNSIQEELRQSPFSKEITQLTQSGPDEIHCNFEHVDFDSMIVWLLEFTQKQNVTVRQAAVKKLNNVGLVQMELVLKVG